MTIGLAELRTPAITHRDPHTRDRAPVSSCLPESLQPAHCPEPSHPSAKNEWSDVVTFLGTDTTRNRSASQAWFFHAPPADAVPPATHRESGRLFSYRYGRG